MNNRHDDQEFNVMAKEHSNMISGSFWTTIGLLAIASLALALSGGLNVQKRDTVTVAEDPVGIEPLEIPTTTLESILREIAPQSAYLEVEPEIGNLLEDVYGPVYASIPSYSDFHYSVLGHYTELLAAAQGEMAEALIEKLFFGFEARLQSAAVQLDQRYVEAYRDAVQAELQKELPPEDFQRPLGELTSSALEDAINRAKVSAPVAGVAASVVGSGAVRSLAVLVAKRMAAKVATQAAAKGIAKGGGILTGAGGGALVCAPTGFFAILCGAAGATGAWLLTDAAVVNLDEYFNRAEFEAELRTLIDADRARMTRILEAALQRKAAQLEDFLMRDLGEQ